MLDSQRPSIVPATSSEAVSDVAGGVAAYARGMRLAALPAAVAAALGLYQLGDQSIWVDEAFTADRTERSYGDLVWELQWLHFTLIKAWSSLVGTSELAMRLPSVVAAVAGVVLLFGLARMLFDERVALVSGLLLAVNPFVVRWSQQGRGYTVVLALAIGATWLLLRARDRRGLASWAFYGASVVALIHWHIFAGLLLVPVHIVVAWRSREAWLTWLLVAIASFAWFVNMADGVESGGPWSDWIPAPNLETVVEIAADVPGAYGLGLALAVLGVFYVKGERRTLLLAWAALPFLLCLLLSMANPVLLDRYLIASCPAFALLGAVALTSLPQRVRVVAATATAAAVAVALGISYAHDGSNAWHGEDWRAATAYAMQRGGAEVEPEWASIAFDYYDGRLDKTGWVIELRLPGERWRPACSVPFGDKLRVRRWKQGSVCDLP